MRTVSRVVAMLVAAVAIVAVVGIYLIYLMFVPPPQVLLIPEGTRVGTGGGAFMFAVPGASLRLYGRWYADLGGNVSVVPESQPCTACSTAPPACPPAPWNGIADIVLAPGTYELRMQPVHTLVVTSDLRLVDPGTGDTGLAGGVVYTRCNTIA